MRKFFVFIVALVALNSAQAQFLSWGLKAGAQQTGVKFKNTPTFNGVTANVNVEGALTEIKDLILKQGDRQWGFHAGAFVRLKILAVYVQPELIFTQSRGQVVLSGITSANQAYNTAMEQKFNRFDVPVLVGVKFGPARVNLGPVATFTINETGNFRDKMNEITSQTIDNKFKGATFGFQVGAGVDILKTVSLDIRYEGNLSRLGDNVRIGSQTFNTDQRSNQLILSLGVYL